MHERQPGFAAELARGLGRIAEHAIPLVERSERGQPVLVGTIAVETSEYLAQLLDRAGVSHNVLNAKQHEREAEIIKDAGQPGTVTIATNMAGRGVDIQLGPGVVEVGGLCVIGTERHEARRIDNQLRGRSGRQGDPGESRFYLSGDDDLVRLFAGDRIKRVMEISRVPEEEPIEHRILSRQIEGAQKKVEEMNFVSRKHVLKYDEVMNMQRQVIYEQRRRVLDGERLFNIVRADARLKRLPIVAFSALRKPLAALSVLTPAASSPTSHSLGHKPSRSVSA